MRLSAAGKVALAYALFSLLWILGSDRLLLALFPKAETLTLWQTAKGFLFVALSGLLVYLLALRETRAEEAKTRAERASARRLQALLESGRELVYLLDEKGRIRYVSPNVREVLGYLPWEDPGPGPLTLDYVHPEDRLLAEAALQDLLRHPGTTLEYRLRVLDKEGGVRAVRVWGRNLLQDEAVGAIVLKVQDVSELEAERARLERVLASLPGTVYQAQVEEGQDPAYAPLVYAAPAQTEALLGYPAEALPRRPCLLFFPGPPRGPGRARGRPVPSGGGTRRGSGPHLPLLAREKGGLGLAPGHPRLPPRNPPSHRVHLRGHGRGGVGAPLSRPGGDRPGPHPHVAGGRPHPARVRQAGLRQPRGPAPHRVHPGRNPGPAHLGVRPPPGAGAGAKPRAGPA
jgi:PAS domain S-box-containing protein